MIAEDEVQYVTSKKSNCCTHFCTKQTLKRCFPMLSWLPQYTLDDLKCDLVAGFTVGLTVIPQGLALAQLACLPPQYGLYTAFMGSFMYALLGTCKDLVIGPTSVMALMTAEYAQIGGPPYAIMLTFLCGCIQLLLGFLNLGFLVNFISSPVLSGFMSAAAIIIATTQLKGLFGLQFKSRGFTDTIYKFFINIPNTNFCDMTMGFSGIFILLLLRHFKDRNFLKDSKLPLHLQKVLQTVWWTLATAYWHCSIDLTHDETVSNKALNSGHFWTIYGHGRNAILVILCSGIAASLLSLEMDILSLTQHVDAGLPTFALPSFTIHEYDSSTNVTIYKDMVDILKDLESGVVIVPLLSLLEAIAIAKSFSKSRQFDATKEMIALGMGNLMGSFVSSYPVTGSFSRTVINNSSGVRTPMGGIFTGSLVLLALGVIAPSFHYIPKSCLSAIIFSAVIFMIHYKDIPIMWKANKLELIPFSTTFFCSFTLGLEYGLLIGVFVSLSMLLYRQNKPIININTKKVGNGDIHIHVIPDTSIYFPSIEYFKGKVIKALWDNKDHSKHIIIIHGDYFTSIDYSAAMGIKSMVESLKKDGVITVFKCLKPSVLKVMCSFQESLVLCQTDQEFQEFIEDDVLRKNVPHAQPDELVCRVQESVALESNSIEPLLAEVQVNEDEQNCKFAPRV